MLNNKNILVIIAGELASNYVTIIHPLQLLQKTYSFNFNVITITTAAQINFNFAQYDIAICVRIINASAHTVLMQLVHKKIPIIYIIDDDFTTMNNISVIKENPHKTIPKFCNLATFVIVTTETLYHKYKDCSKYITIIGICMDLELFKSFNIIKNYTNSNLRIGYAAADDHYPNLQIALPGLINILKKYPNVSLELFFNNKVRELSNFHNVTYLGVIPNIFTYYKSISERNWDIGIAPLVNTVFNSSKSDLKYREYAILRIPGIYSNVTTYKHVSNTGLLCDDTEWENKLEELIINPGKRLELSQKAYYYISQICSYENIHNIYLNIFKHCFGVTA